MNKKQNVAAIIAGVISSVFVLLVSISIICDVTNDINYNFIIGMLLIAIFLSVPVVIVGCIIYAVNERIKEIKEEEKDDISKY